MATKLSRYSLQLMTFNYQPLTRRPGVKTPCFGTHFSWKYHDSCLICRRNLRWQVDCPVHGRHSLIAVRATYITSNDRPDYMITLDGAASGASKGPAVSRPKSMGLSLSMLVFWPFDACSLSSSVLRPLAVGHLHCTASAGLMEFCVASWRPSLPAACTPPFFLHFLGQTERPKRRPFVAMAMTKLSWPAPLRLARHLPLLSRSLFLESAAASAW